MKKHLLFAAMLALGAAPSMATPVVNNVLSVSAASDVAPEENYQLVMTNLLYLQETLQTELAELQEKFPLADTYIGAIQATLTGEGGLEQTINEMKAKHDAGTLTSEELEKYKSLSIEWNETFCGEGYKQILVDAEAENATGLLYQYANESLDEISAAEEELPDLVYDYFSSAMDIYGSQIQAVQYGTEVKTAAEAEKYKPQFEELAAKAVAMASYAQDAADLVKDIKATLPGYEEQIEKGKKDFPDFDWESAQETVDYWKEIVKTLTDYVDEDAEIITKADMDDMVEYFSYFKEENVYEMAQKEAWQQEYSDKYYPISERISDIYVILDEECPDVAEKYMMQLDDLNAEMTQAMMKFYGDDPVTQEDVDKMMARLDQIAQEVEDILTKAKAEQLATGIHGVNAENADKDAQVYTIDGKRVNHVNKGLYIKNGKKVVLK